MKWKFPHLPKHLLAGLSAILIAALLAGGLTLVVFSRSPSNAFAAALQQVIGMTCVQFPNSEHCDNQDPELQGCAADAKTLGQPVEIKENMIPIGKVERRWSERCGSWWGRVFDTRVASHANMYITIDGTTLSASPTFVNEHYRILYSFMIFNATPTQLVPAISGALEIDGITTPPSATLPAVRQSSI